MSCICYQCGESSLGGKIYKKPALALELRKDYVLSLGVVLFMFLLLFIFNPNMRYSVRDLVHSVNQTNTKQLLDVSKVRNMSSEKVTRLIKEGADVNAVDGNGRTPLMQAAMQSSNPDVLRVLIENGANVTIKNNIGKRALDIAEQNEALKGTDALNLLREKTLAATE